MKGIKARHRKLWCFSGIFFNRRGFDLPSVVFLLVVQAETQLVVTQQGSDVLLMFFNVLKLIVSLSGCNQVKLELLFQEVKNKVSLPESIMYFNLLHYSCLCSQW